MGANENTKPVRYQHSKLSIIENQQQPK